MTTRTFLEHSSPKGEEFDHVDMPLNFLDVPFHKFSRKDRGQVRFTSSDVERGREFFDDLSGSVALKAAVTNQLEFGSHGNSSQVVEEVVVELTE